MVLTQSIRGLDAVYTWSSAVFTWSSRGLHVVFAWYSRGLHVVFTRSSRGLHVVFRKSSHGLHMVFMHSSVGFQKVWLYLQEVWFSLYVIYISSSSDFHTVFIWPLPEVVAEIKIEGKKPCYLTMKKNYYLGSIQVSRVQLEKLS